MPPCSILVIDDDPDVRLTFSAFLEDHGYRVIEAENGAEGLVAFAREHPDVTLTDLRMPVMNGFEVISTIIEEFPGTPIIAITGIADAKTAEDAISLGARDCLFKPVTDMRVLLAAIEACMELR